MAFVKTLTLTKTESTPADAFSTYPHPDAEKFAVYSAEYNVTRTVDETANTMVIKLIFSDKYSADLAMEDEFQQQMMSSRAIWVSENFISDSFEAKPVD